MKSKKLFAILTLVAFMMTLVPMAAFGYTAAGSTFKASNTSVSVYNNDEDNLAKVSLTFKTGTVADTAALTFYVKSDRDAEAGYVTNSAGTVIDTLDASLMKTDEGQPIAASDAQNIDGKFYVYVGSDVTGTFKLSVYNEDNADAGLLIGSANITVALGDGTVYLDAENEDDGAIGDYTDAVEGGAAMDAVSADGVELRAYVNDGGNAIEDKEVTFQARYEGGSWYTVGTDTTDEDGYAYYYFEEKKTGTWEYRAKIGDATTDKSGTVTIEVGVAEIKTIELKTANGTKIAEDNANSIDFYIKDVNGNKITNFAAGDFQTAVTVAPEGSKFEDKAYADTVSGISISEAAEADGIARISFTPDKVGKYTLKIRSAAETRVSATIEVEAVEFGKAVSLSFKLKNLQSEEVTALARKYQAATETTNEINLQAGTLEVYAVNAAGVKLRKTSDLTIASADNGKVAVTDAGAVTVKAGATGAYKITVLYEVDNIVATYDLNVVGAPTALKFTPVVEGKTATVSFQYVDASGNNTFTNNATENYKLYIPASVTSSNVKAIDEAGKGSFELKADAYGKYAVTVLTDDKAIAGTFEIEFVQPASEKPVIGAKNVTMFIGAPGYTQDGVAKVSDVAPFIKDGRTFVAVRPVGEAFGAEIGWNEATKTVTLTRSDVTVTVVIGSNAVTVVKAGVTSTVTADVAAFIKDGRTVLPFRAVGEAFGATVNFDAATQAVTYVQ